MRCLLRGTRLSTIGNPADFSGSTMLNNSTEVQALTSSEGGASVLAGYTEQAVWSRINKVSTRSTARYRNLPDGLPWVEFGGRIYIPNSEAAAWLKSRIRHPNKRRAG
jgi:hypothetical protein